MIAAAPRASWLMAGPGAGPESLAGHVRRLGPCPSGGEDVRAAVAESGLRGRGGARFPASGKWEAVASRARGRAVVVVNGAEGEPASCKDQLLLALRPHLVLDGAVLAARSVGARDVIVYVGAGLRHAEAAVEAALRERAGSDRKVRFRLASAPARYVAGEETAAVSFLNGGDAKPAVVPPRPFERGVGGRPTLVQNVETLAAVALVARFGGRWFRGAGTADSPGTTLLTVRGAVSAPGVLEVPHGVSLADAVDRAGGSAERAAGVLLGGYFGTWLPGRWAASLPLDDRSLAAARASLGCGVVAVLPESTCGVTETSRVFGYLASESARQCGPCRVGLPALAGVLADVARGRATPEHADRLRRWTAQLGGGRG
ncbi:MAG TPA: NADH-ubiquinone oxidoreductase-F iron-sulfur binding region domain-containing protein, partial [Candidatus Eisenbacteria bacterium]|nr:NADH-ubiquinone oxidoreductase-F iron-sulfur binding region domain-containing protein [Candidatus Eisenbacteria bacterium]